jgi:hypothetical protein
MTRRTAPPVEEVFGSAATIATSRTAIVASVIDANGVYRHRGPARVFADEHETIQAIKGTSARSHERLPDDSRLWAALQRASGTWAGCVYDVDRIVAALRRPE